ncbi:hypothetical protein K488DRAFT_74837 [Vararia minispora EC-137]|uniref:Uncharacterized protein n=1 Tax=Vararia minispora EC-137 TaxID=1314806 RepID=A0ACB8Q5L3_9AGAM|nr:hypothetical protein K488DRAFT_74837 [Vararia minispora EC-137]
MDIERVQDNMVDYLTSVTTPLGHLISIFWSVCGLIGFRVQIGSRIKKALSLDMYVFGIVEELLGFSDALAVFAVRLDGIGSEWVQRRLFGEGQLVGPVGSMDIHMVMAHVVEYWTLRLIACSNARTRDYGALDNIPSIARSVFDQESTASIKEDTSEDVSGSDLPEDAGDGILFDEWLASNELFQIREKQEELVFGDIQS